MPKASLMPSTASEACLGFVDVILGLASCTSRSAQMERELEALVDAAVAKVLECHAVPDGTLVLRLQQAQLENVELRSAHSEALAELKRLRSVLGALCSHNGVYRMPCVSIAFWGVTFHHCRHCRRYLPSVRAVVDTAHPSNAASALAVQLSWRGRARNCRGCSDRRWTQVLPKSSSSSLTSSSSRQSSWVMLIIRCSLLGSGPSHQLLQRRQRAPPLLPQPQPHPQLLPTHLHTALRMSSSWSGGWLT